MIRLSVLAALCLLAVPAFAQGRPAAEAGGKTGTAEEHRYDELIANFQKDYFRVTTLVQIAPHIAFEDNEGNEAGFDVAAAWLGVNGKLGENVGYFVRGAFERTPTLLEAYVSYGSDDVRGLVGRQKAPFSAEFLTAAADIDFVNRARAVRAIAPGRSTGAALNANPNGGPLRLRAGVFNSTSRGYSVAAGAPPDSRINGQNDRGGFLFAGRAQGAVPVGLGQLVVGASAGYNTEDTSERFDSPHEVLLGADARLRVGRLLLAGEYIRSDRDGPVNDGGYATAGVDVSADDRLLVRFDTFNGSNEVLFGYNRTLTRAASIQVNVIAPLDDDAEPTQALANFQLAF